MRKKGSLVLGIVLEVGSTNYSLYHFFSSMNKFNKSVTYILQKIYLIYTFHKFQLLYVFPQL